MSISFKESLTDHLSKFSTAPYLFVGSGLSRRYLNFPTWIDLFKSIVTELKLDKPFEYYLSNSNGDYPRIATLIGEDLNDLWWNEERFEDSRNDFKHLAINKQSILKYEITKYLLKLNNQPLKELSDELNLLRKVNIDGIITTNWDEFLEYVFPDYAVYIGQEELLFSEQISIGQLYKIHGSLIDPNSLILNSDDYHDFNARYPYLAAKLLTIFVEQPIIFIGYSLDDHNIQEILKSIIHCLTKEKVQKLQDRLLICQWEPQLSSPSLSDTTMLISGTVLPIKLLKLPDFKQLFEVLANNKKRLPIKILRHMKDMIYDFVKTSNPKNQIFVSEDLDKLEEGQDVEFVYGIGLKDKLSEHGVKGITLRDLLKDVLIDNGWNPSKISRMVLTNQQARYIPYFKYLSKANFLDESGNIPYDSPVREFTPDFIEKINLIALKDFLPSDSYCKKQKEINERYSTLTELIEKENLYHASIYIPLIDLAKISTDVLENFLKQNVEEIANNTHLRKLICYFDFLKNKLKM